MIQREEEAAGRHRADWIPIGVFRDAPCCYVCGVDGDPGIKINGLVLMQTEHVNILCLNHRFGIEGPGVAAVELFGYRVPVVRVHDAASGARIQVMRWGRNHGQRIYTKSPVAQRNTRAWHNLAAAD